MSLSHAKIHSSAGSIWRLLILSLMLLSSGLGTQIASAAPSCEDLFLVRSFEARTEPSELDARALTVLRSIDQLASLPDYQRADVETIKLFQDMVNPSANAVSEFLHNSNKYPNLDIEMSQANTASSIYEQFSSDVQKLSKWTSIKRGWAIRLAAKSAKLEQARIQQHQHNTRVGHKNLLEQLNKMEQETSDLRQGRIELQGKIESLAQSIEKTSELVNIIGIRVDAHKGATDTVADIERKIYVHLSQVEKDLISLMTVAQAVAERMEQGIDFNIATARDIRASLQKDLSIIVAGSATPLDVSPLRAQRLSLASRASDAFKKSRKSLAGLAIAATLVGTGVGYYEYTHTPEHLAKIAAEEQAAAQAKAEAERVLNEQRAEYTRHQAEAARIAAKQRAAEEKLQAEQERQRVEQEKQRIEAARKEVQKHPREVHAKIKTILEGAFSLEDKVTMLHKALTEIDVISDYELLYILEHMPRNLGWGKTNFAPFYEHLAAEGFTKWEAGWTGFDWIILDLATSKTMAFGLTEAELPKIQLQMNEIIKSSKTADGKKDEFITEVASFFSYRYLKIATHGK